MDCAGSTCSEMLGGEGNCRGTQGLWHTGKVQAHINSSRDQHSPIELQMLSASDSQQHETALYWVEEGFNRFLIISQSHKSISSVFAVLPPVQRSQSWGKGRSPMAFTGCCFYVSAHWHSCTQWSMLILFSALGEKSHGVFPAFSWIWITFFCVLLY